MTVLIQSVAYILVEKSQELWFQCRSFLELEVSRLGIDPFQSITRLLAKLYTTGIWSGHK